MLPNETDFLGIATFMGLGRALEANGIELPETGEMKRQIKIARNEIRLEEARSPYSTILGTTDRVLSYAGSPVGTPITSPNAGPPARQSLSLALPLTGTPVGSQ